MHARLTSTLTAWVDRHGTQRTAAAALGISQAYLSDILHGRRRANDCILSQLGLRRREVIERVTER